MIFAIAVWLRLQSVKVNEETANAPVVSSSGGSSESLGVPRRGDGTTTTPAASASVAATTTEEPEELRGTRGTSSREERYRELLNAPVATSTGAAGNGVVRHEAGPNEDEPSFLEKAADTIAEAIGAKKSEPPPPALKPAARQARLQQDQNPAKREEPKNETPRPGQKDEEKTPQKDQESDTIAPRLLAAEFIPNQVQDGDVTTFAVMASDDLSGVRSVSGVIVSPSGSQHGFACQREGDGQRFSTRFTVPKEAAEGMWSVKYMTLMDNANNTAQLTTAQGSLPVTARFNVTSPSSDSKGPVLKSIWLEKPSMQAGEKNLVNLQVDDDRSGVGLVSGVFISPSKQARIGFGCRQTTGDTWQCPITPTACVDCGAWTLEQVQLQDKANNMTTLRQDNPFVQQVRLQLFGEGCDAAPPQLTSIALNPTTVANGQQNTITVTIIATDDQCGVASLSGRATPPPNTASQAIHFPLRPAGDGQTFVGEITLHPNSANGLWSINWVQAIDKGHNQKTYTNSDPVVAGATFTVE